MSDLPPRHPLAEYGDLLDTHEGHLEAFANVLEDTDPDETYGAMVVLYGEDGCDTLPTVAPDTDPRLVSLWMLGAHIHHVSSSGKPSLTMEEVAQDAIEYVRQAGIPDELE